MSSSVLRIEIETIVGDHDGYCSGDENDDTIRYDVLFIDTNRIINTNHSIQAIMLHYMNDYNRSELLDYIIEQEYFEPHLFIRGGGGSYYCDVSPNGLSHDTRSKIISIKVIRSNDPEINDDVIFGDIQIHEIIDKILDVDMH